MRASAPATTLCTPAFCFHTVQLCLCRPIAQMEYISRNTVLLSFRGFYIDCDIVSNWLRRQSGSFTPNFPLCFPSAESQQKHVLQDLSQALQAQRFWRLVLDHLKRPVNKAESFRYKPSESAPLQRGTDSQKYYCWQCCGTDRKTRSLFYCTASNFLGMCCDQHSLQDWLMHSIYHAV